MVRGVVTRSLVDLVKVTRYVVLAAALVLVIALLVLVIRAFSAPLIGSWWKELAIGWAVCAVPSSFLYVELGLKGEKLSRGDYLKTVLSEYPRGFLFLPLMLVIALISLPAWLFDRPRERFERRLGQQLRRLGVAPVWDETRYRREEKAIRHDQAPLRRDRVIEVLEGLPDNAGASAARKAIAAADP